MLLQFLLTGVLWIAFMIAARATDTDSEQCGANGCAEGDYYLDLNVANLRACEYNAFYLMYMSMSRASPSSASIDRGTLFRIICACSERFAMSSAPSPILREVFRVRCVKPFI